MNNTIPPIPQDPIGENIRWREWFRNLGNYITSIEFGSFILDVAHGGTGATSLSGYLRGTGNAVVGETFVPSSAVSGLSIVATTGNYSDLVGTPTGATGTFLSGDATPKTITVTNGIITSIL